MKMSDVFALPVRRVGNTLADEGGYADGEGEADAAVHAINCHDKLVEALKKIAAWDSHTIEFAVDYGSNGVRDLYREIARKALEDASR